KKKKKIFLKLLLKKKNKKKKKKKTQKQKKKMQCDEKTKAVGCHPNARVVAVWGRVQRCSSDESGLAFTADVGTKCEEFPPPESRRRYNTARDIEFLTHPGGAWLISSPEGFHDVHVFADPVSKNVCRLMLWPNTVTKPIQIGAE